MPTLRASLPILALIALWFLLANTMTANPGTTRRAKDFVAGHEKRIRPLEVANNLAWWNASTTGSKAAFKRKEAAQNKLDDALADRRHFAEAKALRAARGEIDDPLMARAVELIYLQYLEKQVDTKLLRQMSAKSNAVEEKFNKFRAKVDGAELTDNQVREILKESVDSKRLKAVWEASKVVGAEVEAELKALVRLRNQAARQLGYANFHALQLHLAEQDGAELLRLFDELDKLTRKPFEAAKADLDARLARRYGVRANELMPWHYHDPFFQDTPKVFAADLDAPFRKADIVRMCQRFYASIGLPIDRVLANSDLEEKKGKSPHAFCTDIDRAGDVRVLANIKPNHQWASTMLHELGHSVYTTNNDNVPATLPYVLRGDAHTLTTEGIAMMFERLASREAFLRGVGIKVADPKAFDESAAQALRYRLLIFSRWCQVMLRFEKAMYEDPEQDLNKLWWDLVERYQGLKRPAGRNAPDYASKIHIVVAPVYYHNYMMGELFASQLHHAIAREVYGGADPNTVIYLGNKKVGAFLKQRVFAPGKSRPWNDLTRFATGAPLNARGFAADFRAR
jgi:peptidyl-dipeptidase A